MAQLRKTALLLALSHSLFAAIQITSSPFLPSGKAGQNYSYTFTSSGATNPLWGVAAGSPPQGLTLDSGTGVLSGIPQGGGFYSFQVQLNDQSGATVQQIVTAQFTSQLSLIIENPALQEGIVGQPLVFPPVTGGAPPYVWSLQSGLLPPGLTLNPNGFVVDGTYTTPGTYNFTLLVTDSTKANLSVPVKLAVIVSPAALAGNFPTLRSGLPYDFQIAITGGLPPFTFQTTSVDGLQIDPTGKATGTAEPSGSQSLIFLDATGAKIYLSIHFPVAPPGVLISDTSVNVLSQTVFTFYLPVPGGNPPFSWSGKLPGGITLDPTAGVLQGIIDQPSTVTIPITSINGAGQQVTTSYSITASPNPLTIVTTSLDPVFATDNLASLIQVSGAQGTPVITVDAEGNFGQVSVGSLIAGTYQATITVFDSGNTAQKTIPLIVAPSSLQFAPSTLTNLESGSMFPQKVQATGGTPPYQYTAPEPSMLPAGVTIDASGNLNGTYTTPGDYVFPVQVTDATGATVYQAFEIRVTSTGEFLGTLPSGVVGVPYAASLLGPYAPPGPYTYQGSTGLPPEFAFDASGTLRGLPLLTGVHQFEITAISGQGESEFTLQTVVFGPNPALVPRTLPDLQVGAEYSAVLPTTLSKATSWTLGPAALPAGMQFDKASGTLSGTPTTPGLYGLVATAANQSSTDAAIYTFYVVSSSPVLAISPAALPPIDVQNQTFTLSVAGGVPPYQWTLTQGSGSVAAFDLSSSFAGLAPVTNSVTVQVTDSAGRTGSIDYDVTYVPGVLVAAPTSPVQGTVGVPLSYQLQITGGIPPYRFTYLNVPGFVVTPAGLLTGIPQKPGTFTFGGIATDSAGSFQNPFSVPMVIQPQPVTVATSRLFNAHPGVQYLCPLEASGGTPPYQWTAAGLPAGLKLSPSGIVFGTPAQPQSAPVLVTVQDSTGSTAAASLPFFVDVSVPAISPGGVTGAASYVNAAISPAEIITIFGSALGPPSVQFNTPVNGAFPAELEQTQILINGKAAPLIYLQEYQASAVVPASVGGQPATSVVVVRNGVASAPVLVFVNAVTPGVFTLNASGTGPAAVLNQDETVNSESNPATSGSVISLFVTGTGATIPALPDGGLAPLSPPFPVPVSLPGAFVGGLPASVLYAGPAPGEIYGLTQINIQLPSNVPPGAVPIVFTQIPAIPVFSSQIGTVVWVK